MTIGQLAAAAGVPPATVRYYEQRGLLAAAPRTRAGYRIYDAEVLRRLRFIRHAQALGFSLEDVQALLALRVTDPESCTHVEVTTREKLDGVRDRIRELRQMERALTALVRSCKTRQPTDECPVLSALTDELADPQHAVLARPRSSSGRRSRPRTPRRTETSA